MEEQLKETFGVMVYQEDVLKIGHHFGGLDLADADVLRRMMSGKHRSKKHLEEIERKYYDNCKRAGHTVELAREVWRQIESFAGYSFSKAHSASYAVESYQSLYLKTYYPLEFMVAVINNFGGFYSTRVYVNEARKAGACIHLPCVNKSQPATTIYGSDIYLGFTHIKGLDENQVHNIPLERDLNGLYTDLEDFIHRTRITLEHVVSLIRIGALRFSGKNKKQLLWEAHTLLGKSTQDDHAPRLFAASAKKFELPVFEVSKVEDAYDELELLGFTVTLTSFDLLKTDFRGACAARELVSWVGNQVKMVGSLVTTKDVRTVRGDMMHFGTFMDPAGDFFDTTHFPPSLQHSPFKGPGLYLVLGSVVEEFGFPSIEVERMAKLPIITDPRAREESKKTLERSSDATTEEEHQHVYAAAENNAGQQ